MKRLDIIEIAEKCAMGGGDPLPDYSGHIDRLWRFANMVIENERKICVEYIKNRLLDEGICGKQYADDLAKDLQSGRHSQ